MNVLVACEYSGVVRDAFRKRGHNAWSCDLLPTERPGPHLICDARTRLRHCPESHEPWDLLIAHPPCTYILNSGCKHLYLGMKRFNDDGTENPRNPERWARMVEGAEFFKAMLNAPIPRICVENPIMVGYALEIVGQDFTQLIQPWNFGHGETKATCLWLKNLPPLEFTHRKDDWFAQPEPEAREQRIHNMAPSPARGLERSRTYQGIAEAMASQWGNLKPIQHHELIGNL